MGAQEEWQFHRNVNVFPLGRRCHSEHLHTQPFQTRRQRAVQRHLVIGIVTRTSFQEAANRYALEAYVGTSSGREQRHVCAHAHEAAAVVERAPQGVQQEQTQETHASAIHNSVSDTAD